MVPPDLSGARSRYIHRVVRGSQVRQAAAIVGAAFAPLPASEWLVPEPDRRRDVLTGVFTILVTHALDYGHVDLLTQAGPAPETAEPPGRAAVAVAVWFHNETPSPRPPNYDHRLRLTAGAFADRFARLDALFDANRPPEPHHHLALLAVRPEHQGERIGTTLLQHHHAWLGARRMPAYLEAAGPDCRRLYTDHGYRSHADAFALPNGARFYPMWRDPEVDAGWPGLESVRRRERRRAGRVGE